ncbi:MAG: replicative DNA helicase [Chloroflexi bacterium]|nr:replicative DNA helicase [Chloroflexota bacterium]
MQNQKLPPHDINAEEAVIGSLLIDGSAAYQVATFLQQPDFYSERNMLLYGACLSLYQRNEAINQITVAQELDRQGKLETCGGVAYLSHLISICPTSLDIEEYARIVNRLSVMRRLIESADRIAEIGYKADPDVDASLNKADDILFKLRHGQSDRGLVPIRQVLNKYFEGAATVDGAQSIERSTHIPSGFIAVDDFLDGFQRSDLVIIAGRPGMGKTSFALNIARNVAVQQKATVAMFSLEMSRESVVQRLLASESGVNLRRFQMASHPEHEERRIMDAIGVLSEAPLYIDDSPQVRVVEMRSKARRLFYERGIDLVIVDYLQLMQGDRRDNRVQEVSEISRSLKLLARELNAPVIAVSQLSRAVEWRSTHRPQLSDLRESGSIEQDADVVGFIYREEMYVQREDWDAQHPGEEYPEGIAEFIIAKHRNGPTGDVKLRFRGSVTRFENLENISSEEKSFL